MAHSSNAKLCSVCGRKIWRFSDSPTRKKWVRKYKYFGTWTRCREHVGVLLNEVRV